MLLVDATSPIGRVVRLRERFLVSLAAWASTVGEVLRAPNGRAALSTVFRYISQVAKGIRREDILAAVEQAAPETKETVMGFVEEWIQEGIEKGRREGIEKSRRLVERQLTLKFGELGAEQARRLASATDAELELWAERVLSAASLEDVLGG